MLDENSPVIPKDTTRIEREQFAGIHHRQRIPVRTLDQMADILFDPRDEEPLRPGETEADAMASLRTYRSPMQRKVHGDPNSVEARRIVGRAEEFYAGAETPDPVRYDATLDYYDLQRGAKEDPDLLRRTKAALGVGLTATEKWREKIQRKRRLKRHARYNRGKAHRPRKRCGR